jgi:hypothetical protein
MGQSFCKAPDRLLPAARAVCIERPGRYMVMYVCMCVSGRALRKIPPQLGCPRPKLLRSTLVLVRMPLLCQPVCLLEYRFLYSFVARSWRSQSKGSKLDHGGGIGRAQIQQRQEARSFAEKPRLVENARKQHKQRLNVRTRRMFGGVEAKGDE